MRELYRVLSPEGWAILQVPVSLLLESTYEDWSADTPEKREKYFGQSDHVRIYGRDYKNRLEEAGFKVLVFNPEKEWGNDFIFKYAIQKNEDLYICTK
jgi:predicted SAM-dependent methyltransferase